ncbi:hypothetical protein RRG08_012905 [Elysia crispata]|uniref:Uncharacterized protein n=1 Tax=Elysia crispata TaxID=231223 RepID=A0AAE1CYH0_9GAST|nr:hypothetical protein RRG08_012905 [Elysia crispata]
MLKLIAIFNITALLFSYAQAWASVLNAQGYDDAHRERSLFWVKFEEFIKMMYSFVLIAAAASFLIPSARMHGLDCEGLSHCNFLMDFGPDGTFSYLMMPRPTTKNEWTKKWRAICSSKLNRVNCSHGNDCTNKTINEEAMVRRKLAWWMCKPDGLKYFRRIYDNRDACLGNTTALQLWTVYNAECKQQGTDTITLDMSTEEKCQIVNQTRICSVEYAAQQCTYLSGWVTDTSWMARILVSFSECYDELKPSRLRLN